MDVWGELVECEAVGQTVRREGLEIIEGGVPPTAWPSAATYGSRRDADIESILEEV